MGWKARAGFAVAVLGVGTLAAWPEISGRIAEHVISSQLERMAEQGGYELTEFHYDRGFSESKLTAHFQGKGLRSLNNETLELDGTVVHGSAWNLPGLVTVQGNVQLTQGQGDSAYSYGGEVDGGISLWGDAHATLDMAPSVFPVEGQEGVVAALDTYTITFNGNMKDADQVFTMSPLTLRVEQPGRPSFQFESSPSSVHWDLASKNIKVEIPSLALIQDGQKQPMARVDDVSVDSRDVDINGAVASSIKLSTGEVYVEGRDEAVLKGMAMSSSLENVSFDGLQDLLDAVQSASSDENVANQKTMAAVYTLLNGQPAYRMDDLTLDTGHGVLSMNFAMSAKKGAGDAWQKLLGAGGEKTPVDDSQLMEVFDGQVGIQIDAPLIDWGCRSISTMQTTDSFQADMIAGACGQLVKQGHFLQGSCTANSCRVKMMEVQKTWQKDLSLEARFDGKGVTLNGVKFEPQDLMGLL